MKITASLCGALLLAMPGLSVATDYPLTFKTLDAQQAISFNLGSTTYAMIQAGKPAGIVKAPPAISQHPLYGTIAAGRDQMLFRLDESKGTGQGYDRLIVDVNRNGDLTDDPVVSPAPPARGANSITILSSPQQIIFGPIWAPDSLKIGPDRPAFYAQVYIFNQPATMVANPNSAVGDVMVKPGWYLEAMVDAGGKKHKVDLVDADYNFKIGDSAQAVNSQSSVVGSAASWLFQGGDRFLVDWNGPASTQSSVVDDQSCSFGSILCLDGQPHKATLAADFKSLSLDPWTEPMAELALPHSEQISSLHVGWEKAPGEWVLLKPGVENGTAKVPPGNYRLYSVNLKAKTASGDFLVMSGTKRVPGNSIKAVAGVATFFKCGAPLELGVTTQQTRSVSSTSSSVLGSLATALLGQSGPAVTIQATILGAGGETYSRPYLMSGNGALSLPPGPTFAVLSEGKQVDSGSLEYG
ncbi:MAG TPA: hypothetical protein VN765_12470 [Candidatus Acidoferrum sp.]|nr:hypothetical protein [Candidatus Acidoferrum sp.]